jgi:hypothetical protein
LQINSNGSRVPRSEVHIMPQQSAQKTSDEGRRIIFGGRCQKDARIIRAEWWPVPQLR